MPDKHKRQQLIRRLVRKQAIATQDALSDCLQQEGLGVNQATLSRDLAELGIRKVDGRYAVDDKPVNGAAAGTIDFSRGIVSCTTCGPHLVVLRTLAGQAQAVAAVIDAAGEPAVTGTVAGDDTLFVATRHASFSERRPS